MPCIGDYPEIRFGPSLHKLPGCHDRTHAVVTPLNDHSRDITNPLDVIEQLVLVLEEASVDEVMHFDTCERKGKIRRTEVVHEIGVGE